MFTSLVRISTEQTMILCSETSLRKCGGQTTFKLVFVLLLIASRLVKTKRSYVIQFNYLRSSLTSVASVQMEQSHRVLVLCSRCLTFLCMCSCWDNFIATQNKVQCKCTQPLFLKLLPKFDSALTTVINGNCVHEEIKNRLNSGNAYLVMYPSVSCLRTSV